MTGATVQRFADFGADRDMMAFCAPFSGKMTCKLMDQVGPDHHLADLPFRQHVIGVNNPFLMRVPIRDDEDTFGPAVINAHAP